MNFEEEKLLLSLKNRDNDAIRFIYKTHWPVILRLVKINNGNEDEAKDLFQESMLDFLEKVWNRDFVSRCKIGTFLYSISRNKWLSILRGRQKFIDIAEYADIEEPKDNNESDFNLPSDKQVMDSIRSLGEPCQTLLVGFYYEQVSMEELAQLLNYKSVNVAKQQKFRCKDRLKTALLKFV